MVDYHVYLEEKLAARVEQQRLAFRPMPSRTKWLGYLIELGLASADLVKGAVPAADVEWERKDG